MTCPAVKQRTRKTAKCRAISNDKWPSDMSRIGGKGSSLIGFFTSLFSSQSSQSISSVPVQSVRDACNMFPTVETRITCARFTISTPVRISQTTKKSFPHRSVYRIIWDTDVCRVRPAAIDRNTPAATAAAFLLDAMPSPKPAGTIVASTTRDAREAPRETRARSIMVTMAKAVRDMKVLAVEKMSRADGPLQKAISIPVNKKCSERPIAVVVTFTVLRVSRVS
mmetsp:Transcript_2319/g.6941  ORF Transcript_2319/g.6941 Transcript_2319/m.6941 type:complete len:224 (-) Transcript_2319:1038-1709(-)